MVVEKSFPVYALDGLRCITISGPSTDSSFEIASFESSTEYEVANSDVAGRVVFDIGAGYGEFTALCLLRGARKIFSFEPNELVFPYLEKNLGDFPTVELHRKGVFSFSGSSVLFARPEGTASGSIQEVQYNPSDPSGLDRSKQVIELVGIGTILEKSQERYVLKIDAEGSEYDILATAASLGALDRCDATWIEYHRGPQNLPDLLISAGLSPVISPKDSEMGLIVGKRVRS